jgi:hypothetical protein
VILFWASWGPMISYRRGTFAVEDLNPQARIKFNLTRGEVWRMGWRCIWASITDRQGPD